MVITDIRKPYPYTLHALPDGGFVYKTRVSLNGYVQPTDYDSSFYDFSDVNQTAVEIGNVYIDGIRYEEDDTEAECRATEKSWYFDSTEQELFVHVAHAKRLEASDFDTAQIFGNSSEHVFYDEDGTEYLPFVDSATSITETADRLVYDNIAFKEQSLSLNNSNGDFDDFYDNPTPGSDVEYKYISNENVLADKKTLVDIYVGYVYDDSFSTESYGVTVKDKRYKLSQTWPTDTFTEEDYPDMSDNLDEIIPDGYGEAGYIDAFCTNDDTTTGTVSYRCCAVATVIGQVVVSVDDVWTEVDKVSTDLTTGSFVISEADGRDDDGNVYECRVYTTLRGKGKPHEMIIDLLSTVAGIDYTSDNYDTAQIDDENTSYFVDDDQSFLYATEEEEIYEYIKDLQGAGVYGFRFYVNSSGKYSVKVDDIHRAISKTYEAIDNISDKVEVERGLDEYATSVEITYKSPTAEDEDDEEVTYLYDDDEQTIFNDYRVYQKHEATISSVYLAQATAKAERIQEDYAIARGNISITLNGIIAHEIYDVVYIDTSVYNKGIKTREYLGMRKIKLSEITYDFDEESTTISGYDISEVD